MNPLRGCLCAEKWNFHVHAQEDRFVEDKKHGGTPLIVL
jgi:hypothetical protein